jgi:hypothetical protein
MIEWTGKTTDGKTIDTLEAENYHDLFNKLDSLITSNGTPSYFDRDLMVEFLSKKEPKLAKLDQEIEKADEDSEDEVSEKLFEEETNLIYKTVDSLSENEVSELIEFAGEAFINEVE